MEFEGLEVKPYVQQATGRLAYSISARVMRAPRPQSAKTTGSGSGKEAAA